MGNISLRVTGNKKGCVCGVVHSFYSNRAILPFYLPAAAEGASKATKLPYYSR
jgi:hypothetical protein